MGLGLGLAGVRMDHVRLVCCWRADAIVSNDGLTDEEKALRSESLWRSDAITGLVVVSIRWSVFAFGWLLPLGSPDTHSVKGLHSIEYHRIRFYIVVRSPWFTLG